MIESPIEFGQQTVGFLSERCAGVGEVDKVEVRFLVHETSVYEIRANLAEVARENYGMAPRSM
jgi:hypothetical protein